MICPECKTGNPDKAKLCKDCGNPMRSGNSEPDRSGARNAAFSPGHRDKLPSTASQPVCAIHGSPCLLDMVLRSSTCLTQTMDVDHFLEVVTEELVKSMEVEAAGILLYDDRLNDFYWRDVRDSNRVMVGKTSESTLPIERAIIEQAFRSGEALVVQDGTGRAAPGSDRENHTESRLHNALLVPLNTREKTTGLLVLANKKTGPFMERDIEVLGSLAAVVAMSLENADFFDELLGSYRKVVSLERMKSKILHRLSHELQTPLAVMKASLRLVETGLKQRGIQGFESALARLFRQVENLGRLEMQVDSIMKRGHVEEREMISGLLESAASLIEVHAEQTPEIGRVASLLLKTLKDAFPANREQWGRIDLAGFGKSVLDHARGQMAQQGRLLNLTAEFDEGSEIHIPDLVLHATMEGLVRNAVEATPDNGVVSVRGRSRGDFYVFTVRDSGIGIPEEDWGLVFEGFYQVQETEDYTSGRPYAFNAGGKGMDLFRIKMFSKIYEFGLYFKSRRCRHLMESLRQCPGSVDRCPCCNSLADCIDSGGTVFEVELPLVGPASCRSSKASFR